MPLKPHAPWTSIFQGITFHRNFDVIGRLQPIQLRFTRQPKCAGQTPPDIATAQDRIGIRQWWATRLCAHWRHASP